MDFYIQTLKEGVHQFYKFVLKYKVRYTVTAVICDFPQICFYKVRQLFRFPELVLREHNLADLRKITYNGSISVSGLIF